MATCQPEPMEDPDLVLPPQYTHIPIRALRATPRKKIAQFLNLEGNLIVVEPDPGYGPEELDLVNNYNGLAELIQCNYLEISNIMRCKSPTEELLEHWTSVSDSGGGRKAPATVGNLWRFLYMMERFDVLKDCRRSICNDCRVYEENRAIEAEAQQFNIEQDPTVSNSDMKVDETKYVDREGVLTGKDIHYNAFVSWSQDDTEDLRFVRELIEELEKGRGLKLFVPGRDDLPGSAYHVITAFLIEKKCDRVILVLSKSFLKCAACDFQLKFAHALAPGARSKKLIPVLRDKNTYIPRILKFLAVCDFSKVDMRDWVVDRLYSAIIAPMGPETFMDEFEPDIPEEMRQQARRELSSSIYPQSKSSCFNALAAESYDDTASSSGVGSSMGYSRATERSHLDSTSQLSGSYSDSSLSSSSTDQTITPETSQLATSRPASISQYFPSAHSSTDPDRSQPQSKSAVVKSKKEKENSGKGFKNRLFALAKGRSKKHSRPTKEDNPEAAGTSQSEVMYPPVDVRKYNQGIIRKSSENVDNGSDPRVSTSSEEFVKLENPFARQRDSDFRPPGDCDPPTSSQSAVLGSRQWTSDQGIPLGYRSTVSEVVRSKTKPELPPKPKTDLRERRSRSPHEENSGQEEPMIYHI